MEMWQSLELSQMCRDCQHTGMRQTQQRLGGLVGPIHSCSKCKILIISKCVIGIATEQAPRNFALMNNLNEKAAERKVISVLLLSLGIVAE